MLFMGWICFGSLFSSYLYPVLPLETGRCPDVNSTSVFVNSTTICFDGNGCSSHAAKEAFILYKMSYPWIPSVGCFAAAIAIFIGILFT
ncbi:hypothetical protein NPIL_454301, partial [Nephila pilipes]